jgi:hypothetical protein
MFLCSRLARHPPARRSLVRGLRLRGKTRDWSLGMLRATQEPLARWVPLLLGPRTFSTAILACTILGGVSFTCAEEASSAHNQKTWICNYIATTSQGPLQITAKFQVLGDELAEIETIPRSLNFSERYKILEDTDTDIVAAISIARFGDNPPPGIGAVIVIISKKNGLFQQSGSLLGLRTGVPTLGHCESQP